MYFLVLPLLFSLSSVSRPPLLLLVVRPAAAVIETACAAFEQSPVPLMLPLPVNTRSPMSSHDSQSAKMSAGGAASESRAKASKPRNASVAPHDRALRPAPASTGAAGATSEGSVKSKATREPEPTSGESGRCRAEHRARETVVGESSGEGARGAGARAATCRANAAATSSAAAAASEEEGEEGGGGASSGCKPALGVTPGRRRGAGFWRCCCRRDREGASGRAEARQEEIIVIRAVAVESFFFFFCSKSSASLPFFSFEERETPPSHFELPPWLSRPYL